MDNVNNSTPKQSYVDVKSVSKQFTVMDLLDPRSPTTAFQRTPIQFNLKNQNDTSDGMSVGTNSSEAVQSSSCSFISLSSPQMDRDESLELSASSASYVSLDNLMDIESFNLTSEDLSMIVSDCSSLEEGNVQTEMVPSTTNEHHSAELPPSTEVSESVVPMKDEDIISEQTPQANATNVDSSVLDESSIENEPVIKKPLKKQFFTPNPNKKRNPLGPVDNVCPTTPPSHYSYGSPQGVIREKQWKRIQEERKKLGLEPDENIQLPLFDITASAPSKLMLRKAKMQGRFNIHS